MVGTRDYDRLLAHASAAAATVVLVGDDRQLAAIEAGGYLRGVVTRVGAVFLRENLRQRHQFDRDTLVLQRDGNAAEAMAIWRTHGRVTAVDTGEEAKATMLARWWVSPHRPGHQSVMLAYQRADVAALNAAAPTMRVEHGEVSADGLTIAGQKVRCRRPGHRPPQARTLGPDRERDPCHDHRDRQRGGDDHRVHRRRRQAHPCRV